MTQDRILARIAKRLNDLKEEPSIKGNSTVSSMIIELGYLAEMAQGQHPIQPQT